MRFLNVMLYFTLLSVVMSCNIFSDRGDELYKKGKYTICKKNLMSYYFASPDLFVKTAKGEVNINLNPYSTKRIAQEKISFTEINQITNDSIQIHFISNDTSLNSLKSQVININVQQAVDSIQSGKQ